MANENQSAFDILNTLFTDIADSIRQKDPSKVGTSINAVDFPSNILDIPTTSSQVKVFSKTAGASKERFTDLAGQNRNLYPLYLYRNSSELNFEPDLIFCIAGSEIIFCSYWIRSNKTNADCISVPFAMTSQGAIGTGLFSVSYSTTFPSDYVKFPTNSTNASTTYNVIAVKF